MDSPLRCLKPLKIRVPSARSSGHPLPGEQVKILRSDASLHRFAPDRKLNFLKIFYNRGSRQKKGASFFLQADYIGLAAHIPTDCSTARSARFYL